MVELTPGTIGNPTSAEKNVEYTSNVSGSPLVGVYSFPATSGEVVMVVSEIYDTNPSFTLYDTELYIYKPSNNNYTSSTYDYYNDDDSGPEDLPYDFNLGYGSRIKFTADETGTYIIIVAQYGESF